MEALSRFHPQYRGREGEKKRERERERERENTYCTFVSSA
jgi:hypothetical protein